MNSKIKIFLGALILIAFVVAVERYIGWVELLRPWQSASPVELAGAIALTFLTYGLRAMRLHDYFSTLLRGQFAANMKLTLQHNLLNNLLPMRAGELSFPVLMSRYFSVQPGVSIPVLFWFRLMDLHTLIAIALFAAGDLWLDHRYVLPLVFAWLTLPVLSFHAHQRGSRVLRDADGGWKKFAAKVLASFPQTSTAFWRAWFWTWVNWLVKLAVFAWVLRMFIDSPWSAAWLAAIFGDATSVLPIHGVAGAGTYEAGVIAALAPAGIDMNTAVRGAVNLHLFLLGSTLLGGIAAAFLPAPERKNGNS